MLHWLYLASFLIVAVVHAQFCVFLFHLLIVHFSSVMFYVFMGVFSTVVVSLTVLSAVCVCHVVFLCFDDKIIKVDR